MTGSLCTREPRATVVVTCYNQEQWIEQALDSVAAQTERDLQLIVTDDGSSDNSKARIDRWLARHNVRGEFVASDHNVGLPAMLNRAMPHFTGRYVIVLNGDDWLEPNRIASQAAALEGAPESVGLVYSKVRLVHADGSPTGKIFPFPEIELREGRVLLHIIQKSMIGMGCIMFRRSVLDTIGPWDESLVADDYDFLLRVAAADFEFIHLPVVVANVRWYGGSMTKTRGAVLTEGRIRALYKLLGRDAETDRAIVNGVREEAITLHGAGYDGHTTRRHLWFVIRRQPSKRVARVLLESYLRLRPGALTPASIRRALRRTSPFVRRR